MPVPSNWNLINLVGFLVNDDNDPAANWSVKVESSQTRLQDATSHRIIFPGADTVTPGSDGYFCVPAVISDTDTDITPAGRSHKVTLLRSGAAVQSWFVTIDHTAAVQLRFDGSNNIVLSGGTLTDALWITSLTEFTDAPTVTPVNPGSGGSADLSNYFTKAQTTSEADARIARHSNPSIVPDPHGQYALDSDLAGKANTSDLTAHSAATNNPHAVTKSQVGLGNVDNTSDATKQAAYDARYFPKPDETGAAVGKVVAVAAVDGQGKVTGWNVITPAGGGGGGGAVSSVAGRTGDVVVGWADLSGMLPTSKLPPLGITDVFPVTNQAARLALTAQRGDIAVQASPAPAKTYALATDDPTQDANWVLLPAIGSVQTVNGQQGAVVLAASDVGAVPISLVDAKGDQLVGTANDTLTRVPVGADGKVWTADSTAPAGVSWQTPASGASTTYVDLQIAATKSLALVYALAMGD